MSAIHVVDLGARPYGEILELQRRLCRERVAGQRSEDLLLLVEHPPVITLGRSTRDTSLPLPRALLEQQGLEVFEIERGGDVTLHAPGQLVGYPIFDLKEHRQDLHWYLRQIEEALISGLAEFRIPGDRNPGFTGVWTGGRKIASIGIHVKQWVTFHGFALNVTTALDLFDLIVPCGIHGVTMTSIARETGRTDDLMSAARERIAVGFAGAFERTVTWSDESILGPREPEPLSER